jgi:hypothetical protein
LKKILISFSRSSIVSVENKELFEVLRMKVTKDTTAYHDYYSDIARKDKMILFIEIYEINAPSLISYSIFSIVLITKILLKAYF